MLVSIPNIHYVAAWHLENKVRNVSDDVIKPCDKEITCELSVISPKDFVWLLCNEAVLYILSNKAKSFLREQNWTIPFGIIVQVNDQSVLFDPAVTVTIIKKKLYRNKHSLSST